MHLKVSNGSDQLSKRHGRASTRRLKRNILAAVIAGALSGGAFAQSSVTLSGLVDAFAGSMQPAGSQRTTVLGSAGMSTPYWGVSGTEDLGGGMNAEFNLASFFRTNTGATGRFNGNETMFSRDAYVGLKGGFGTVHLGRDLAPNFLPTVLFNAFGDSFTFSPIVLHANVPLFNGTGWPSLNAGDTGWSNQIRYVTPNIGGLTASLDYQIGGVAGDNSQHNIGANFLYFNGRFGLGGFVHQVRVNNPLPGTLGNVELGFSQQNAWMLSGKAGFGIVNVYANYEQTRNDNYNGPAGNADSKTWSLSADIAAGPGKVMVAYASTKWTTSPTSSLDGAKRGTASLGYDYILSKRTDLYAVYMNDKITNYNTGNSFGVGMRHRF
ncbi:MAG: Outer membrane porin [Burkholderiaceae bacterium]|jgi:predicted porin|nr:MAG: Outer membrane porin [Burkholderiaceae bacterium]